MGKNVSYELKIFKKDKEWCSLKITVGPKTKLSKVAEKAINELEQIVINQGWVTTYAGVFGLIFIPDYTKPIAMVTYKPSFNYSTFFGAKDIYEEVSAITPELKL